MEPNTVDILDYPDCQMDITEYHTDYSILNGRSDKSSSGVWKHFGTLKYHETVDRKHVYCIQCFMNRKIKKYQRSTSTGNLSKHLRKYHRISLNQTFRIKKESENNTIVSIQKEHSLNDIDDDNLNGACSTGDGEEFLIHDINEILIAEVAKRPLLYTSMSQREKGVKHQTRRQLWTEIYEALNELIPYPRLPKIWKNIRDRYHKVRRRIESAPDSPQPRYRYYELLRFLDDSKCDQTSPQGEHGEGEEFENYVDEFLSSNENGKYITSDPIEIVPNVKPELGVETYEPKTKRAKMTTAEEYQIEVQPTKQKTIYTLASEIIAESPENCAESNVHLEVVNSDGAGTHTILTQQLQPQESIQSHITEVICDNSESATKSSSRTKKPDEYDIFGNFMAEVMRNMGKSQSRKLQMNILGLISDAENAQ